MDYLGTWPLDKHVSTTFPKEIRWITHCKDLRALKSTSEPVASTFICHKLNFDQKNIWNYSYSKSLSLGSIELSRNYLLKNIRITIPSTVRQHIKLNKNQYIKIKPWTILWIRLWLPALYWGVFCKDIYVSITSNAIRIPRNRFCSCYKSPLFFSMLRTMETRLPNYETLTLLPKASYNWRQNKETISTNTASKD